MLHHSAATATAVGRKRTHLRAIWLNAFIVSSGNTEINTAKTTKHDKQASTQHWAAASPTGRDSATVIDQRLLSGGWQRA